MPRLYDFTGAYNDVWAMIDDPDADLVALDDTLQSLEGDIEAKAENIIKYIKCLEADAEAIKEEEQRLAAKRRAAQNKRENLRSYLANCLTVAGISKVRTTVATASITPGKGSVEIIDADAIPDAFIARIERHIDKRAVGDALKAGEDIPGARMSAPKPTITIK